MMDSVFVKNEVKLGGGIGADGNPIGLISGVPENSIEYSDANYRYYCSSAGGSAKTDAVWKVTRSTLADNTTTYASDIANNIAFGAYAFRADDLATVAALEYNNGVQL